MFGPGGSLKGMVKANFTSTFLQATWKPPPPIVKNIGLMKNVSADEDCALLTLNADQINELIEKVDNFELNVEFEEEGTGTTEKSYWSGNVVDEAIKLDIGSNQMTCFL